MLRITMGAVVAAALLASGCGDTKTTTVIKTVKDSQAQRPAASRAKKSCKALGINPKIGNEGTCTDDGIKLTVVNKDSKLRLTELNAELLKVETSTSALGDGGDPPNGTYVIFTLAITNKTDSPQSFASAGSEDVSYVSLGDKRYSPDSSASIYADNGFGSQDKEIQPGERRVGKLIFDIPTPAVGKLRSKAAASNLVLAAQFDISDVDELKRAGIFRLYQ